MPFTDPPHCPICGATISLVAIWQITPTDRLGLLRQSTGVVCPNCNTKLRITQGRSLLAVLSSFGAMILCSILVIDSVAISKPIRATLTVLLAVVIVVFPERLAARFARLKRREGSDVVDFPLERLKEKAAESDQDAVNGESDQSFEGPAWRCKVCHEENPGTFDMCWHCNGVKKNGI